MCFAPRKKPRVSRKISAERVVISEFFPAVSPALFHWPAGKIAECAREGVRERGCTHVRFCRNECFPGFRNPVWIFMSDHLDLGAVDGIYIPPPSSPPPLFPLFVRSRNKLLSPPSLLLPPSVRLDPWLYIIQYFPARSILESTLRRERTG